MQKILFVLLLLVVSCNPVSRLQKEQTKIAAIVDAANNNKILVKDSVVYVTGETKSDTVTYTHFDSLTRVITNEHFYYNYFRDTVKIIKTDLSLLTSARRAGDIATGEIQQLEKSISGKDKTTLILFVVCLLEALIIGFIIYFKFKL